MIDIYCFYVVIDLFYVLSRISYVLSKYIKTIFHPHCLQISHHHASLPSDASQVYL